MDGIKRLIRNVPDFPKKGIGFKDITTLLKDSKAFSQTIDTLCEPYLNSNVDMVVGIESRGFIFGGAAAIKLEAGFVPIRKKGKLPAETFCEEYALEYGTDTIEIHKDAITKGMKVLLIDDLLATGGTAAASVRLLRRVGSEIVGAAFLIELGFLGGREQLVGVPLHVLINYEEE